MTARVGADPRPRIGVFGGTFDPPHLGHLLLAEAARDRLALDRVLFVPARIPPHKRGRRVTPPAIRLALLRAALAGTGFSVSTLELDRPGPSYTVDTLERLGARHPRARFWLLVGADSLAELPTWRDPERILALARLAVADRPGAAPPPPSLRHHARRVVHLGNSPVQIASSDVRRRVARGRSIRFLVPAAVERRVRALGLYRR
ncbi:MAG: nicotinate-nucleotide adenylyltransferase [Candidatus Eisenbacteria bacterium]